MNNEINFRQLREKLNPEDIKRILRKLNIEPVHETEQYIIYPTVCHNLSGGSHKLYYYKDTRLFKCYTKCEGLFDIFELLIKINSLRGNEINIYTAIKFCDLKTSEFFGNNKIDTTADISYLYNLLHTKSIDVKLPSIDENILNRFIFDKTILELWNKEGISFDTMKKFNIKYDPIENCIIIPNYDIKGNLISIRGRFLSIDAEAKYKPIFYCNQVLSHPSSLTLYGINITKQAIKKNKKAIIFEGEKSVMMMDSYYGNNNYSVATLGKNISTQQIKTLIKLGVEEVILAYDRDYTDYTSMNKKRKEYMSIAENLKTYFNVCILLDLDLDTLDYKDSPIDKGPKKFEKILKDRIYL